MKYFKIVDYITKAARLLTNQERRTWIYLVLLSLTSSAFDTLSVISLFPFLTLLTSANESDWPVAIKTIQQWVPHLDKYQFIVLIGLISLVTLICSVLMRAILNNRQLSFFYTTEYSISSRLFRLYLHQSYGWHSKKHSSELSKNLISEVNNFTQGTLVPLSSLASNLPLSMCMVGVAIFIEPVYSSAVFVILVLAYLFSYKISNYFLASIAQERYVANQLRFKVISEAFSTIKYVKAIAAEDLFWNLYREPALEYSRKYVRAQLVATSPKYFLEILIFGTVITWPLLLILNQFSFIDDAPKLVIIAAAVYRLLPSLQAVFAAFVNLRFQTESMANISNEFTSLQRSYDLPTHSPDKVTRCEQFRRIELRNVSLSYASNQSPSLKNISLSFDSGSTIGLVGLSGSGKTSLADLILGLQFPSNGKILVNGQNQSELAASGIWHSQVAYVPQDVCILDDTIKANITLGSPSMHDHNWLEKCCQLAAIHDYIISLPQGYMTRVGERGSMLSGGQRQRIGLARALYRKPRLLVLDEATSALDPMTERMVLQSIFDSKGDMAIVMIAHRIEAIAKCERIIILDNSCIVGDGCYQELLATNIYFKQLCNSGEYS